MFLRRKNKKSRGIGYSYWHLCETVRTARGPRQRVVASLGKLDEVEVAGLRGGWNVRVYEQGACPAPRITFFKNDAPNTACDAFREAAIKEIVRIKPAVVVVTSASYYQRTGRSSSEYATPEQWEPGLTTERLSGMR